MLDKGLIRRRSCALLAAVVMLLAAAGCAVNPVSGRQEFMLVSESQEIEMGTSFYPNALWGDVGGGGEYRDDQLKGYLRDLVLRIHGVSHRPHLPVDFVVQNSSMPNAWAIPGHVAITRGLVAGLEDEAEFVFVMGHEMGHVSARHSARQMSYGMAQQIGLDVTGVALGGSGYGDLAVGLGSVGSSLLLLKYGRDDELEADRLGVRYMGILGYDRMQAVSAHRNLERIAQNYLKAVGRESTERSFFEDLLSTHPRSSVRVEEIQQLIDASPAAVRVGDGRNRERFQRMTSGVREKNRIYLQHFDPAMAELGRNNVTEAESLAQKALREDSREPAFHALMGFVRIKKKDYASAERAFDDALALQSDYAPAYRGKGAALYNRGRYDEARSVLEQGLKIFPQDLASHYFLGMSLYRIKRYDTALPHLKGFAEAQPKHPEIHGVLGITYENLRDPANAYREYTLQVQVDAKNEMGRHAAERIPILKPAAEQPRSR